MLKPDAVDRLASGLPRAVAPTEVLEELEAVERRGKTLVVACSGGADSVAAALWTAAHFPALLQSGRMVLGHVHHGLRGAAADRDAEFVERLAGALGARSDVRRFQPPEDVSEDALRRERLKLLNFIAAESDASVIVFGHQADDVVENLLFRMVRGGTLAGMAGLRPRQAIADQPLRLRPLIRVARSGILKSLRESGVAWREDASNADSVWTRNRLRKEVAPALAAVFPERNLPASAAALHAELVEADALIDRMARDWIGDARAGEGENMLHRLSLAAQPRAVRRRILEKWSRQSMGRPLRRSVLEELLAALDREALEGAREWSVAPGRVLRLDQAALALKPARVPAPTTVWPAEPLVLRPERTLTLPDGAQLGAKIVSLDEIRLNAVRAGSVQPDSEAYLAIEELGEASVLFVRAWRPGDRFRPLGAPGSRKLQDWFTDRGISPARRRQLPVVCAEDGEVLWVPGFAPAQSRILRSNAGRALWLTYQDQ